MLILILSFIFTIKNPHLNGPIVILSVKDSQNFSKLLTKGFKNVLLYWNEYKTECENKRITSKYAYFI